MVDDAARRAASQRLYERMIRAQNAKDRVGFLACLDEACVFEAPYYRPDEPIARGKAAMGSMFDTLCEKFSSISYEVKRLVPALDPDLVIAEVRGNNAVAGSGRMYRNDYLFLVSIRHGLITRIFEYSNPTVYARDVDGL
ncbi:MAG TPA: nuclear transport factor 2 family protein [Pseudonocardiaceae bacterium]|jgi:ketosteroid isomerase-like protein|nr:nuclear transport factor 2 family protein [Pseudonocardiaceae bacterium]